MTAPAPPIPADAGLPQMATLLDPAAMLEPLARSLRRPGDLRGVRIAYLRYKPGQNLCVHYEAAVDGATEHAVAYVAPGERLAEVAVRPDHAERARLAGPRAPARDPLVHHAGLDALLCWLPFDLDLPALSQPPEALRARLAAAGIDVAANAQPELLQYRPRRRVALRLERHVLKAYRNRAAYDASVAGLVAGERVDGIRTATTDALVPDWLLTVQELLDGEPPVRRIAAAGAAGALARRLHAAPLDGLPRLLPEHRLKAAAVAVRVVATVAPPLAGRAAALLAELERTRPDMGEMVPAHGDFHGGQLLETEGGAALIDWDLLGAAPRALDLATYAGHLIPREAPDVGAAAEAIESLVEGYGQRPPFIPWYLSASILRRARVPFRNFEPDWPELTEVMIGAAEDALRL